MSEPKYLNIFTTKEHIKSDLLSDNNLLTYNLINNSATYLPSVINKKYINYYEAILVNDERIIFILEDKINSTIVNDITGNNKSLLKKIYISNSCESIESSTFENCSNLEYISYTNILNNVSLTTIKSNAFKNCTKLIECKLFNTTTQISTLLRARLRHRTMSRHWPVLRLTSLP